MSFLSKLHWTEHALAVAGAGIVGFLSSAAGQAIVHQYPVLAPVAAAITFFAAFYHAPKSN